MPSSSRGCAGAEAVAEAIEEGFRQRLPVPPRAPGRHPGGRRPAVAAGRVPDSRPPAPDDAVCGAELSARPPMSEGRVPWSSALDALNRTVSQSHDRPEVWRVTGRGAPVARAARRPAFHRAHRSSQRPFMRVTACSSTATTCNPASMPSPTAWSACRWSTLDAKLERVRDALAVSVHSRYATEPIPDDEGDLDVTSGEFPGGACPVDRARAPRAQHGDRAGPRGVRKGRRRAAAGSAVVPRPSSLRRVDGAGALPRGGRGRDGRPAVGVGRPRRARSAARESGPRRLRRRRSRRRIGARLDVYALAMTGSFLEDAEVTALASDVAAHITRSGLRRTPPSTSWPARPAPRWDCSRCIA